eukprot:TRINITY_DN10580_c0_g1_i1.p1 TRINITY_DN10580_c0_g1~~TRINITY_DN10580_c0_g1_i1.p1  ORF type:complete len:218 (+),score=25.62 TRINITY_DN10580_c0_g1_i1:36-689(+)
MTSSFSESYDYLLKLLLIGNSGVGKTSLLLQFTDDNFSNSVRSTVGVDLKKKMIKMRDKTIKACIWDTAGQERFRTMTSAYYRGAHGIIIVYDVTDRESFENVRDWIKEIDLYSTNEDAVKLMVGNKIDKNSERKVSKEEALAFSRSHSMMYLESSAKTKVGVQQAFEELIQKILDVPSLLDDNRGSTSSDFGDRKSSGSVTVTDSKEAPSGVCPCI